MTLDRAHAAWGAGFPITPALLASFDRPTMRECETCLTETADRFCGPCAEVERALDDDADMWMDY